jgi:hypothetical protein
MQGPDTLKTIAEERISRPPSSHERLTAIAEEVLREAGAFGTVPTPLDAVIESQGLARVEDAEAKVEAFLSSLPEDTAGTGERALSKLQGILDRREGQIWVSRDNDIVNAEKFPTAHEIGHDAIEWHGVNQSYLDDEETLSPAIRERFEREANFFAGELLFQGTEFRDRALSRRVSLSSALALAEKYETTYQSTAWRYAEVQECPILLAVYGRAEEEDKRGYSFFNLQRLHASEGFREEVSEPRLPRRLSSRHRWMETVTAGGSDDISEGGYELPLQGDTRMARWESWCNHYSLFVLLRCEPPLR